MKKVNLFLKRVFDITASLIGVIILLPVFLIIAVLIKMSSKGPILFKQKRLGKAGKEFWIYKFRTMVVNAEYIGEGLRVSTEDDPRITKIGRFLRATSLDELPQLFNTLNGTMSLVGPRPPVTYHPYKGYTNYPEWAKERFEMRPGITGLAQVTVRNSVSWDERIKVDNQYIENFNIGMDIRILFKTVLKVLKREDIYGKKEK
ncbi:sugar transferase [Coprococcus sp. AF21-14LB]|uniref:sugar transferase n=1 Tax=Coprococcus sp. AF21-14LB TaxID=2292231 RepID=UPI000E4CD59F|nr:sugar transferase [Coprococcus sp. AF21-14LB]RGS81321.1 sugar transferase [Coprococcus sp. AF21-14LB]